MIIESKIIKDHLNDLRKLPQLTHEEFLELFEKKDNFSRNKILECNLRLVVSIAKRYTKNNQIPLEDLIQEGSFGLIKAYNKYDPKSGNRFSTYATWWIRQCIGNFIQNKKRTIRMPAHALAVQKKMLKFTDEFRNEHDGQTPDDDVLQKGVGATNTVVKATTFAGNGTLSLDSPVHSSQNHSHDGRDDITYEDMLCDEEQDPFTKCVDKEIAHIIRQVLKTLTPKEEKILRLRFGISEQNNNVEEYPISVEESENLLNEIET